MVQYKLPKLGGGGGEVIRAMPERKKISLRRASLTDFITYSYIGYIRYLIICSDEVDGLLDVFVFTAAEFGPKIGIFVYHGCNNHDF